MCSVHPMCMFLLSVCLVSLYRVSLLSDCPVYLSGMSVLCACSVCLSWLAVLSVRAVYPRQSCLNVICFTSVPLFFVGLACCALLSAADAYLPGLCRPSDMCVCPVRVAYLLRLSVCPPGMSCMCALSVNPVCVDSLSVSFGCHVCLSGVQVP